MNRTKKIRKRNKKKCITQKSYHGGLNGGKVKGSGGYGCFLVPAVRCKNHTRDKNGKNISKLMLATKAKKEYNEIIKYKKI